MKVWPFWDQHHHSDSQTTASVVVVVANHPNVAPTTPQLQEEKKQPENVVSLPESSDGLKRRDDLHHLLLSPVPSSSQSSDSSSSSTTSFSSSSSSSGEDDGQSHSSSSCSTECPPSGSQVIVRQHNGRNHHHHEPNNLLSWWDPTSFFRLLTKPQPLQSSFSRSLAPSSSLWSSSPPLSLQPDFFLGWISVGLYHVNLFAYRSWSEIVLRKQLPSMVLDTTMTSVGMSKNTMIALKDNQCHDGDDSDCVISPVEDDNSICDVSISSEVANSITEYSNHDYDVVHPVPFDTHESNGSLNMPHDHVDHDLQDNKLIVAVETTAFEAKTGETNGDDSRLVESPTGIMDELHESFLSMGGRNEYCGDDDEDGCEERSFSSMVVSTSHILADYDDDEVGQEREQKLDDRESNPPFSSVTLQPRTSYEGSNFDHPSNENEQEAGDTTVTVTPKASTNIHTMTELPSTSSESPDIDIASHVYGGTKMVWGWSKDHVPLAGIFLGLTEGVANVVVKRVTNGCDLSEVDHQHIQRHLQNLDRGILNPVMHNIFDRVIDESVKLQNQGPKGKNLLQHALTPFFCPAAGFLKDHLSRSPRQAVACN